jgi:hypothetical protein
MARGPFVSRPLLLPGAVDWFDTDSPSSSAPPPAPELPRHLARSRRKRELRPAVESIRRLPVIVAREAHETHPDDVSRPRTRGDCESGPRPCPWVSCRHHLALDVTESGGLRHTFPDVEVWEMRETCALDLADREGMTLEEVGDLLNVTREAVRKTETGALAVIRAHLTEGEEE